MLETTGLGTMVKILPLSKIGIARLCEEQADGDRFVHLDFGLHRFQSALHLWASTATATSNLPSERCSQHAIDLIGMLRVVRDRKIHTASLVVFHGVGCELHR